MYNSAVEFANQQTRSALAERIRPATRGDAAAVTRLLGTAVYRHLHVDWNLPGDWLGKPGFVVLPPVNEAAAERAARFVGRRETLPACLAVTAEVPPVAWVRVAALASLPHPDRALAAMMDRVAAALKPQPVSQFAWLMVEKWPRPWLQAMGFEIGSEIETFVKEDTAVARAPVRLDLHIRPATADDFDALAALEAAAFSPLWRQSAQTLKLAQTQSLTFEVALVGDELAAFQISTAGDAGAHLVRLTVHPQWQGKGVGSALLAHTLQGYQRRGFRRASLNTQVDNVSSQALYRKFGFQATGTRFPIWIKELTDDQV